MKGFMLRSASRSIAIIVALGCAATTAAAEDGPVPEVATTAVGPGADDWLRTGLERYERGNLVGAIDAFERGYQRQQLPMFLFALGQAHRKRGDCARARAMYDAFLATAPATAQADAARQQRELCEPQASIATAAAASPPPRPTPGPIGAATPAPATRAWWRDPVAIGAGTSSVALVGTGVALWLAADRAAGDAAATDSYDRHRELRERAASRQLAAGVVFGAAAVAGAVTVWRITRHRDERPRRSVAWQPVIGAGGVGVSLAGHF